MQKRVVLDGIKKKKNGPPWNTAASPPPGHRALSTLALGGGGTEVPRWPKGRVTVSERTETWRHALACATSAEYSIYFGVRVLQYFEDVGDSAYAKHTDLM